MDNSHAGSVEDVLRYFGSDETVGLSDAQVIRNQQQYGPNGNRDIFVILGYSFSPFPKSRACQS